MAWRIRRSVSRTFDSRPLPLGDFRRARSREDTSRLRAIFVGIGFAAGCITSVVAIVKRKAWGRWLGIGTLTACTFLVWMFNFRFWPIRNLDFEALLRMTAILVAYSSPPLVLILLLTLGGATRAYFSHSEVLTGAEYPPPPPRFLP